MGNRPNPNLNKFSIPFKNLGKRGWQRLSLFALCSFYCVKIGLELHANNLFNTIGSDFLAFWTTGYIANTFGYASIYDLPLISQIQKPFHEIIPTDNMYMPIPSPFFSIFAVPLQGLALLEIKLAFTVWTLLNIAGLILYLHFFVRDLTNSRLSSLAEAFLLISFPVFQNLFWGQLNIWLLICFGEFIRATKRQRHFIGGLWLAGILIKPQALILIIPLLLIRRLWKETAGFISGFAFIIVSSLAISGLQGLINMGNIWFKYASGIPTNAPEHMVNWRMMMVQLSLLINPTVGWTVAIVGILATSVFVFQVWAKPMLAGTPSFVIAILGTLAATNVITWHSHIHMMLILLPCLAYLAAQDYIPQKIIDYWIYGPPLALFLSFIWTALNKFNLLSMPASEGLFTGLWGLTFNLLLLTWSVKASKQHSDLLPK